MIAGPLASASEIAGDPRDQPYIAIVLNQALETERTKIDIPWRNPETGHGGVITIERTWYQDTGTPCRDYRRTIGRTGGPTASVRGTGCRIGPAVWTLRETVDTMTPPASPSTSRSSSPRSSSAPPSSSSSTAATPKPTPQPSPPPTVLAPEPASVPSPDPSPPPTVLAPASPPPEAPEPPPDPTQDPSPASAPPKAPALPPFTVPSKAEL